MTQDLRTLVKELFDARAAFENAPLYQDNKQYEAYEAAWSALRDAALAEPAPAPDVAEMLARIRNYLGNGGLFNPEFMDHDKVRDMILDCRTALETLARERDEAAQWAINAVNEMRYSLEAAEARVKALREALKWALPLAEIAMEDHRIRRIRAGHNDIVGKYKSGTSWVGIYQHEVDEIERARAIIKDTADE